MALRSEPRGQSGRSPARISFRGWRDVLLRVSSQASHDNVTLVAAGVAFYALLALFPALAAAVTLYGLIGDPGAIAQQVRDLAVLPPDAREIVLDQLRNLTAPSATALGVGLVLSLGLAFWSASQAAKALVSAMNIAYDAREERGFLRTNALALLLTVSGIVGGVLVVAVLAGIPVLLRILGAGSIASLGVTVLSWAALLLGLHALLACLYRYGPSREPAGWRSVTPGSAFATVLWALGSSVFSVYVSRLGSYNETYGSLGAVVVLLMWFWISAVAVILGAELNAEMEHQVAGEGNGPTGDRGARRHGRPQRARGDGDTWRPAVPTRRHGFTRSARRRLPR